MLLAVWLYRPEPDKYGYAKKTHLIFNYKGENVLKKSDLDYKQENEGTSHWYRMLLKPDNTVRVEIDELNKNKPLWMRKSEDVTHAEYHGLEIIIVQN